MTKPGFGKYDLDTGLALAKKVRVRSKAGTKGLKKDAYQQYKADKEDPLAAAGRQLGNRERTNDAAFLLKVGGHDRDIKDGKMACTHIDDGAGDIGGRGSATPELNDLTAKQGLTAE
jgi:hypothetical protein